MAKKSYELKVNEDSSILKFDDWYADKYGEVKNGRTYKAKTKVFMIEMIEKLLSGETMSGYKDLIEEFIASKNKTELEIMVEKNLKNKPDELKTFKKFIADAKKNN